MFTGSIMNFNIPITRPRERAGDKPGSSNSPWDEARSSSHLGQFLEKFPEYDLPSPAGKPLAPYLLVGA